MVILWWGSEFAPPAPGHDPLETMTQEDYSKVPPPHLLKKFSEQARVDSQKRGHPGYCKTFAKLCIDWALSSKSTSNNLQIRSFDLDVTIALVQQWTDEIYGGPGAVVGSDDICLAKLAAQYGADQELEACCEWFQEFYKTESWVDLDLRTFRAARRPKPATLKEQSLKHLDVMERDGYYLPEILQDLRRALEQLLDNE
jgi:hypothetical protein